MVNFYSPTSLFQGKEPTVLVEKEAGWAAEPVWVFGRREKCLFPARIRTPDLSSQ